ncbi:Rieske 2Fe-2S domain-containing protein [Pararhodobacter oceanensis]|uniref:Rieske 2Fe-2S domain-containing protein n=1 Tax=Pararhodobacter oceanensis TaxID=2172121 RepID=UPI003A92FFC8
MVLDQWSAVALDGQIHTASSNPVKVYGNEVAVWRSTSGKLNAWEDRCPHRGMRLSLGFVEGNRLRCIYHGWGYGTNGQCEVIPAHPGLTPPKTICSNRYAIENRYGLIWANLAEDPQAALPDLGADDGWQGVRSVYLSMPVAQARQAVMADLATWGGSLREGDAVLIDLPEGTQLAVAFHPVDAGSTGVHVVARGPGASGSGLHDLVRRVVLLRNLIEII